MQTNTFNSFKPGEECRRNAYIINEFKRVKQTKVKSKCYLDLHTHRLL